MGEKIMKKTIFYLALAAAAVSCVKEQNPGVEAPEKTLVPMEFVACSEMTKTVLAEDGKVEWIEGDQVAIFDGSSNMNINTGADEGLRFKAKSSGASVVIAGEADPAAEEYYAIYPYGSGHSLKDGVFTSTIKAQQTVTAGSMAENCAVVVAKAEAGSTTMEFKNVCSLVKFPLEVAGVKSLTLIGNNNEVIAGQFKLTWNDGDPHVTANSKPEVAVTLRDAEGADLVPGDYYFTILPTEFTKGFSVILGMNDGTQQIVKRGAVPALLRNQIFRTQNNIPEAAYKAHESNYVKYNDGFALTYSHLTVQIQQDEKGNNVYAKYVNDGVPTVSADGVYFVGAEATAVATKSDLKCNKFILAGDNPQKRSNATVNSLIPQTNNDGVILLADMNIVPTGQICTQPAGGFTSFGDILIYDCKVTTSKNLTDFSKAAVTINKFVVEDTDVIIDGSATTSLYVLRSNGVASVFNEVKFINNVFHNSAKENSTLVNFYLCPSAKSTINDLTIQNNTFVRTLLDVKNGGFVHVAGVGTACEIQNNFFVESHPASGNTVYIIRAAAWNKVVPTIKNNFFYVEGATKELGMYHGTPESSNTSECRTFEQYPLSSDWDPAKGVFGYAEGLTYRKLSATSTEGNVAAYRGAQRTTTPAAQNRAGYGYTSEALGNF